MNTDNSKVNINLLKENEALKERIKELEDVLQEVLDCDPRPADNNDDYHLRVYNDDIKLIVNALNPKT